VHTLEIIKTTAHIKALLSHNQALLGYGIVVVVVVVVVVVAAAAAAVVVDEPAQLSLRPSFRGARGSVVVKALCCKPEGRGFKSQ
jgi:hypothetical protein